MLLIAKWEFYLGWSGLTRAEALIAASLPVPPSARRPLLPPQPATGPAA